MKKLLRILKSRFNKDSEEPWVVERREICLKCEHNTLNKNDISLKLKITTFFSDLYTLMSGNKDEYVNLGVCKCGCDIYYLTNTKEENCSDEPKRWTSIVDTKYKQKYSNKNK